MKYDFECYINTDEFKKAVPFSKYIIEYFKNDYKIIKDFLINNSPWDLVIEWKLSITHEELINKKALMYNVIRKTYEDCLLKPLYDIVMKEEDVKVLPVSMNILYLTSETMPPIKIFSENEEYSTEMIKFYISALKQQTNLKIHTYNNFKKNVQAVIKIYNDEYNKYNLDSEEEDEVIDEYSEELEQAYSFFSEATEKIENYIINHFRSLEEQREFINYLVSLAYAYLKTLSNNYDDEVLDEEIAFMKKIETTDDVVKMLYKDGDAFSILFETLSNNILEYKDSYDLRKSLTDEKSIAVFKKLDPNYDTDFEDDIVVHDYTLDILLEKLLKDYLNKYSNDEIFDLLTDSISMYDDLFSNGLDPRMEKFYKYTIMRKIIVNDYEYLNYLYLIHDNRLTDDFFIEHMKLPKVKEMVHLYFVNNYSELLDIYRSYNKTSINYREKMRLNIYNENKLEKLIITYLYIEGRYLGIMSGLCAPLESVDYTNDILKKLEITNEVEFDNVFEIEKYYKAICFNVYERLISLDDLPNDIKLKSREIIRIITNIENFIEAYYNNRDNFGKIILMFMRLNSREISYYEENNLRRKILDDEKIKILNRINPCGESIPHKK